MPMRYLRVNSHLKRIPIVIGENIWKELKVFIEQNFPGYRIYVLSDSNVAEIYGPEVDSNFTGFTGYQGMLIFPAGEASKSRSRKSGLEDLLLDKKAGRDSILIGLGGGVTGDLVGFLAATLHRGVPVIHVPTSLLAQVDSSIGGKVGINHPAGKNLIGAFYQPAAVYTNPRFLHTLPEEEFRNGLAEVVKYGMILDCEILDWLEEGYEKIREDNSPLLAGLIDRCIRLKIEVVEKDEKESDYRSLLNFGHTVGHAIEKLSNFKIKHGFAVAAGMKVAASLSQQLLDFPPGDVQRMNEILRRCKLDTVNMRKFSGDEIWEIILTDKKSRGQAPRFTLLDKSGKPALFHPVTKKELFRALETA